MNFEDLPNELFYEIFEYLHGYDIYKAFFNLNSRFNNLITCSSFPLKIEFCSRKVSELKDCCKNFIIPYKHRIISFHWVNLLYINTFFKHCILNSSFDYLQSIIVGGASISKIKVLLFYFKSLPRLSSLMTFINGKGGVDLRDIYRMIFSLPSLKYHKMSLFNLDDHDNVKVFMPLAVNNEFSSIECLVINHPCTVNELLSILCHTPRLCRLTIDDYIELGNSVGIEHSTVMSNLTYLHFSAFYEGFDDFEILMAKLLAPLQVLIIDDTYDNETYMDADRWERFIMKYMPDLRRLQFNLSGVFPIEGENTPFNESINRFTSSFWIGRQWFFEVRIMGPASFLIGSYRDMWLDIYKNSEIAMYCNENIVNDSTQPIQLNIMKNYSDTPFESILDKFKSNFVGVQFNRLIINSEDISAELLVKIINLLPNLVSLKVSSLPLIQPGCLFNDEGEICSLTSNNNKITKVNLKNIMNIEQVHFIIHLCTQMQYFQIDVPKDMDPSMLLQFILIKRSTYIPHLNALCLSFSSADEEMVYQLVTIIQSKKFLSDYMIKRIGNHILLKWTSH